MIKRKTQLRKLFSEEDNNSIELFKKKAEVLIEARAKYEGVPSFTYEIKDTTTWTNFTANVPDDDTLIQLFTRFRFFYLQKEPTQFERILNIVRNNVVDTWALNYLDWIKLHYKLVMKDSPILKYLNNPIPNRDIIDLWFNTEYFHSDSRKREKLTTINEKTGLNASKYQLFIAVVSCSAWIESFFITINITNNNHLFIYTPEHHFSTKNN